MDMMVFATMAYFYKYVEPNKPEKGKPKTDGYGATQSSNLKSFEASESVHNSNQSESKL
jgi:hypothetical protein